MRTQGTYIYGCLRMSKAGCLIRDGLVQFTTRTFLRKQFSIIEGSEESGSAVIRAQLVQQYINLLRVGGMLSGQMETADRQRSMDRVAAGMAVTAGYMLIMGL
ncbi:hypothetical protein KIPB_010760 [Kipferlia bialata]|uniref:Uncharacterized protein n=1 Tax=Kipferlia bialata TaxID=797122 RepID=A0A9K3D457_9EUKA|nr:hypothetical protein KIPB_010760 [Kipferlia bialata]|eukprot:g10760.t1